MEELLKLNQLKKVIGDVIDDISLHVDRLYQQVQEVQTFDKICSKQCVFTVRVLSQANQVRIFLIL